MSVISGEAFFEIKVTDLLICICYLKNRICSLILASIVSVLFEEKNSYVPFIYVFRFVIPAQTGVVVHGCTFVKSSSLRNNF